MPEEEDYSALPTRTTTMYAYFHQFFLQYELIVCEAS
jgi:hypothetical protein